MGGGHLVAVCVSHPGMIEIRAELGHKVDRWRQGEYARSTSLAQGMIGRGERQYD